MYQVEHLANMRVCVGDRKMEIMNSAEALSSVWLDSWWNQDEIPCASRSTEEYRPVLCLPVLQIFASVVVVCKCHVYKKNTHCMAEWTTAYVFYTLEG